jgi:hypothetical protein
MTYAATGMHISFFGAPTLLSSSTVLRFSIQMASTGPSKTIQVFWLRLLAALRGWGSKVRHNYSKDSPLAG